MADANFADVSLLLHCNGTDGSTTFTDSGPVEHTLTAAGNAQIDTGQSKWGGASGQFDGTGDWLIVPNHSSLNLATGDFTIECWMRISSHASIRTLINKESGASSQYRLYFDSASVSIKFRTYDVDVSDVLTLEFADGVDVNTWYHIAVVRSGDTFTIYQDGVAGDSATFAYTLLTSTNNVTIGANLSGTQSFSGWLDDIRITKGVARYTSAFTPPTGEFEGAPAVDTVGYIATGPIFGAPELLGAATLVEESFFDNVSLLLNCNGTDASTTFTDSSIIGHAVTAVGNAQIDTAQSKWGGASGLLDGTGDYLTVPDHTSLVLSTGDFTVECWVRVNGATPDQIIMIRSVGAGGVRPWRLWFDSSPARFVFDGQDTGGFTVYQLFSGEASTGVWYHLAGTRSGNVVRFYVDGTMVGSATLTTSLAVPISTVLSIGANSEGSNPFNGWIDDVRITKGVARYTDDVYIPPPEREFPSANNVLGYVSASTILGGEPGVFLFGGGTNTGSVEVDAILGQPDGVALLGGSFYGAISVPSILESNGNARLFGSLVYAFISNAQILSPASVYVSALHDFSAVATDRATTYVMDLLLDAETDERVRVPISSWQGTQQTTNESYLSCVVPACEPWLVPLAAATHFIVLRRVAFDDGSYIESEMARSPLETLQTDQGPTNFTASLSGYSSAFPTVENPTTSRELQGVRSVSVYTSGIRIRCAIDWFLRPAQLATYGETSFQVSYINYYATTNTASVDEYMDIGERITA